MNRRKFIRNLSTGVGCATLALNSIPLSIMAENHHFQMLAASSTNDRILVVLNLNGGNDGLNTLVPINQYDTYVNRRPNIAIPNSGNRAYIKLDQTLSLENQVGLHPDMVGMKELYDRGEVSIVQGVAYPNTNGSHFRGTDIVSMGGGSTDYLTSGWAGRYLDQVFPNYPTNYPNADMPDPLAIELFSQVPLLFSRSGKLSTSFALGNITRFYRLVNGLEGFNDIDNVDPRGVPPTSLSNTDYASEMDFLLGIEQATNVYATRLNDIYDAGSNSTNVTYPETSLGAQFEIIARLLDGGCKTKIYSVRLGGFDTHAAQVEDGDTTIGRHAVNMKTLSEAIKAFQDDLKELGLHDRVLTITTSEFGRRIDSNGSFGTDHGNGAPWFIIGKYAKPGITGNNPDLTTDDKNVPMQYDYRQVLTSVLKDWFGADNQVITKTKFENFTDNTLPIVDAQAITSVDEFINDRFRLNNCYPNPAKSAVEFSFYINTPAEVSFVLSDSKGKKVKTIFSGQKGIGLHKIKVNLEGLQPGVYVYSIKAGLLKDSKKLVIRG